MFGHKNLREGVSGAKFEAQSDLNFRLAVFPPEPGQNEETHICWTKNCDDFLLSNVGKWNVGDRLKRVLPKLEADRSHVRGVNGRSKFRFVCEIRKIGQ